MQLLTLQRPAVPVVPQVSPAQVLPEAAAAVVVFLVDFTTAQQVAQAAAVQVVQHLARLERLALTI
jgi:hypothetical protein